MSSGSNILNVRVFVIEMVYQLYIKGFKNKTNVVTIVSHKENMDQSQANAITVWLNATLWPFLFVLILWCLIRTNTPLRYNKNGIDSLREG
jgi:hypothetical protein